VYHHGGGGGERQAAQFGDDIQETIYMEDQEIER
jgi:hypothetical protein